MSAAPTRAAHAAAAALIDPAVLARIDDLELVARTVVDGFIQGLHRSPYLGLSLDFAEHRPYMPGDDIRRIDWRVWARTDRYYLKQFEAETNANFTVLLDTSKSMAYGSGDVSKLDYGRFLAASLSYFSRKQKDRVGLITFDDRVREFVPTGARNLDEVLYGLHRSQPGPAGDLPEILTSAASRLSRRGIVALVSDLYDEPERVAAGLRALAVRGSDVIVFHVLDPTEIDFPFEDAASFEDLETGELMPVVPGSVAEGYRQAVREHTEAIRTACVKSRIDYVLLNTAQPLDRALFAYLSTRERLRKVR